MHSQSQAHGSDLYGVAPNSERHIGFMIECSTPGSYSTTLSNLLLPCRLTCLHTPRDTGLKFLAHGRRIMQRRSRPRLAGKPESI